jgi:hypothetical protein
MQTQSKVTDYNFDCFWQYQVQGRKFEDMRDALCKGVLSSYKSYYLIYLKNSTLAIFLWRGKNQTLLDWEQA